MVETTTATEQGPAVRRSAPRVRSQEFIGEPMTPASGSGDISTMARGEPGLPFNFTWRDTAYQVRGVIHTWKSSGRCRHGSEEMYLRRHWYKILAEPVDTTGERKSKGSRHAGIPIVMTIYCDRQPKNRRKPKDRWWVYTTEPVEQDAVMAGRRG